MSGPLASFSHVGIHCFDLETMVDFYKDVLGLEEMDSGNVVRGDDKSLKMVFLSASTVDHHQVVLVEGRQAARDAGLHLNQMAFRLESLDDLKTVDKKLKGHGITEARVLTHGNAWSIYFPDPEGNTLETFVDTPWYVKQPHGDPLDLSLSNEDILQATKDLISDDPTFEPVEEWRAKAAKKIGVKV